MQSKLNESVWEKARQNQIRREKFRLFGLGIVRPDSAQPIVMVKKPDGSWKLPSLKHGSVLYG